MQSYSITPNDAEQRLDSFLKKIFSNASLSFIFKMIRTGKVKVILKDGKKLKKKGEYKLQVGEEVQVFLSEKEIDNLREGKKTTDTLIVHEKLSKQDIVYEDESILVLSKSAGINVHPGDHKTTEISVIEQVHDYFGNTLSSLTFKPSLAHRIDRETSGILMIAKEKGALVQLTSDFKNKNALKKTYYCIVVGKLSRSNGTIKKSLIRIENAKNENKVQVSDSGLEAITHYTLLEEYTFKLPEREQIISTVEVTIETGRMHQIRVHMAHIGSPILGDKTYGDKKLNSYFEKKYGVSRQMLHAWRIEFQHPIKKNKMLIEAKLKKDMKQFLDILKK